MTQDNFIFITPLVDNSHNISKINQNILNLFKDSEIHYKNENRTLQNLLYSIGHSWGLNKSYFSNSNDFNLCNILLRVIRYNNKLLKKVLIKLNKIKIEKIIKKLKFIKIIHEKIPEILYGQSNIKKTSPPSYF